MGQPHTKADRWTSGPIDLTDQEVGLVEIITGGLKCARNLITIGRNCIILTKKLIYLMVKKKLPHTGDTESLDRCRW